MIGFALKQVDDIIVKGLVIEIAIIVLPLVNGAEHETGLKCAEINELILK